MFGCIAAGRLVQTNILQIDSNKYTIRIEQASQIQHLVVFLTGQQAFVPNTAATIYFRYLSASAAGSEWRFLGILTNEKPSAVFKLNKNRGVAAEMDAAVEIGISIEPLPLVLEQQQRLCVNSSSISSPSSSLALAPLSLSPAAIAERLLDNFKNYYLSFCDGKQEYIPVKVLQDWYASVIRKCRNDSLFLQRMMNGTGE